MLLFLYMSSLSLFFKYKKSSPKCDTERKSRFNVVFSVDTHSQRIVHTAKINSAVSGKTNDTFLLSPFAAFFLAFAAGFCFSRGLRSGSGGRFGLGLGAGGSCGVHALDGCILRVPGCVGVLQEQPPEVLEARRRPQAPAARQRVSGGREG
jgi:hypothetical protein